MNIKITQIIDSHLADKSKDNYAIYIKSLNTDDQYFLNEDKIFPAGSLYKLYLLAAAFEAIEKGELTEETKITSTKEHLTEVLGFEDFGYEGVTGQISYEVTSILSRIATISDNYASLMLAEKIGWEKVREQAKELGANSTTIKDPISTTAKDIALFWEKLYNGEVVSISASEKILDLLSESKINNRIPAKLPKDTKIAHKTAELSRLRHDAGIVFLANNSSKAQEATFSGSAQPNQGREQAYIIILFSHNLEDENEGVEVLANISKDVYEYFSKSN